jgi:tryptophan synthase alpha chain
MASRSPTISSDTLDARFAAWRTAGRRALIPYLTCGFPTPDDTPALLDALADAGADIIELGVPFSDPVADGPTIQRASQIALEHGVTLADTLGVLADFRTRRDTAVVVFTYLNPLLRYGLERFLDDAVRAGAQGVLVTDLPVGGDEALEAAIEGSPLRLIRLVAPTTAPARAREIARRARGFLYYIARMGVTGARAELRTELAAELAALRQVADVPIAVGFGISTPEQAATVAQAADGVIVGSALIDAIEHGGAAAAADLVRGMRAALDG